MASKNDCFSCKVIGTTFLAVAAGYVYIQGKRWKRKESRIISVIVAFGPFPF